MPADVPHLACSQGLLVLDQQRSTRLQEVLQSFTGIQ